MDARIGTLIVNGKTVYYAFCNGYDKPETRGTLEQVEVALGIKQVAMKNCARVRKSEYKEYEVTVTPKITSYAGSTRDCEYTTIFTAKNAADAIKQAREERKENEGSGRYVVGCTYKARKIA